MRWRTLALGVLVCSLFGDAMGTAQGVSTHPAGRRVEELVQVLNREEGEEILRYIREAFTLLFWDSPLWSVTWKACRGFRGKRELSRSGNSVSYPNTACRRFSGSRRHKAGLP